MATDLDRLEKTTGYAFKDRSLELTALTHSSYANDKLGDPAKGNERLEFLGDSVLDAVMGTALYKLFPEEGEGALTKLRASVVCEPSLAAAGRAIGLDKFLRLGKSEAGKGTRDSIVADAVEALIAAVYLDSGYENAYSFALRLLEDIARDAVSGKLDRDHKSALQELLQKDGEHSVAYRIIAETGPDHAKEFTAEVESDGKSLGTGKGRTKKQAEQEAARIALQKIDSRPGGEERPE